jgi:ATP-binding cassette subfamily C (CFTR/MRP) protein 1
MAIIVSGASYTAAIIPGLVIALYLLQSFYLRTSRQMRHMDLEAKTPLYTLFTEVASGLQHIRAFNWQTTFMDRGLQLLDVSQKPYYLLFCIQRWLTFVLDMFVMAIAVVLVTIAVKITSTTSETAIGLALVNLVGYGESLAQLIQFWTNMETSLGAIARLRTYVDKSPVEKDPEQPCQPPEDWPSAGNINIQDLSARYR